MPSPAEIDFVIRVLSEVLEPAVLALESLARLEVSQQSGAWVNEFCRHCALLKYAIPSIATLAQLPRPTDSGVVVSDAGDEIYEFIDHVPACETSFCLIDVADPRHQLVMSLRQRSAELLHSAVLRLRDNGAEDAIDGVRMIVYVIRTPASALLTFR